MVPWGLFFIIFYLKLSMRKTSRCPTSCFSTLYHVSYSVSSYWSLTDLNCVLYEMVETETNGLTRW